MIGIFKKALPVPDLTKFDSYLFVGPHPDDIELACGGTVAMLTSMGKKVSFVVVTNGCVGSLDESMTEEEIISARQVECRNAAQMLGVSDVTFLPFVDGATEQCPKEITEAITKIIVEKKPQVVFAVDHTVRSETHPDHLTVGKATTDACFYAQWSKMTARMGIKGNAPAPVIAYYFTDRPTAFVKVKKTSKLHIEVLRCFKTQFTEANLKDYQRYFTLREIRYGLKSGKGRAEGFRCLGVVHQHCFPEASEF